MTKFGQLIIAAIILLLFGLGAYWFMRGEDADNNASSGFDLGKSLLGSVSNPVPSGDDSTYENLYWGFSFNHPQEFQITEVEEENGGFTVFAQGPGEKKTFQVFIADFDEPGPITPERIRRDIPDALIESPQMISFAGVDALAFISDEDGEKMVEVWFVQGGALFQVWAFLEFTEGLSEVLSTWKFL